MDTKYRRESVREHIDLIRLMKCKGLPPEIIEREKTTFRAAWKVYREAISRRQEGQRLTDAA